MANGSAHIPATHVGSLVRPDELVAFLRKIDRHEDYDEDAYQACLGDSVRAVVESQRDAGIDVVSDGEFGKSAWNYYVYERLGGIERDISNLKAAMEAAGVNTPTMSPCATSSISSCR